MVHRVYIPIHGTEHPVNRRIRAPNAHANSPRGGVSQRGLTPRSTATIRRRSPEHHAQLETGTDRQCLGNRDPLVITGYLEYVRVERHLDATGQR